MDTVKSLNPILSSMLVNACADVIACQGKMMACDGRHRRDVTAAIDNLKAIVELAVALKDAGVADFDRESIAVLFSQIGEGDRVG